MHSINNQTDYFPMFIIFKNKLSQNIDSGILFDQQKTFFTKKIRILKLTCLILKNHLKSLVIKITVFKHNFVKKIKNIEKR